MNSPDWQQWAERDLWTTCDMELDERHRLKFVWQDGVLRVGAFLVHRRPDGLLCLATISFDVPGSRMIGNRPGAGWKVTQEEPLSIMQSILCRGDHCNDHGFIREGKWVKAG